MLRHVIYFHPRLLTIVPTHLPVMNFLMIDGSGDPNGEPFAQATEALYSFACAVKMSYRNDDMPGGYYEYTVLTLEGVWDLVDWAKPPTDKTNLKYTIMIRQPDFLTQEGFERFLFHTKRKKSNLPIDKVRFERTTDGLSCQMLHLAALTRSRPASSEWKPTARSWDAAARASFIEKSICPIRARRSLLG